MWSETNILIAEDDKDSWDLLELCLKEPGWSFSFVDNGKDALELFDPASVDLLITDYIMPGMNGIDLIKAVKERSKDTFTPVLLMTSETKVMGEASGLNEGADDFVAKPFGANELKARVKSLLRIKALVEELKATQQKLKEEEKKVLALSVIGGAAHQLGQPLTSLNLLCEQLQKKSDSYELVEEVLKQAKEVADILNKLKSTSDIKSTPYANGFKVADFSS